VRPKQSAVRPKQSAVRPKQSAVPPNAKAKEGLAGKTDKPIVKVPNTSYSVSRSVNERFCLFSPVKSGLSAA
jgi:hypothetical protein